MNHDDCEDCAWQEGVTYPLARPASVEESVGGSTAPSLPGCLNDISPLRVEWCGKHQCYQDECPDENFGGLPALLSQLSDFLAVVEESIDAQETVRPYVVSKEECDGKLHELRWVRLILKEMLAGQVVGSTDTVLPASQFNIYEKTVYQCRTCGVEYDSRDDKAWSHRCLVENFSGPAKGVTPE